MSINKTPSRPNNYVRHFRAFANARSAFKVFLQAVSLKPEEIVLLPAYIGWSPNEGSGVLDPVSELNLKHAFYKMDSRLCIDVDDLERLLKTLPVRVLVVIHYFGYVDPSYDEVMSIARRYGVVVLEDEAHAMFTDLIGGCSGRLGDACIFSLHKMLPVNDGGMLVVNDDYRGILDSVDHLDSVKFKCKLPWQFDLERIANARVENAHRLQKLLEPLSGEIDLLRNDLPCGNVPQTYPIIIRNVSRDELYFEMNNAGFGVVSLYHTLVDSIHKHEFTESHRLSHVMLNLPVHQDVCPQDLYDMVNKLNEAIKASSIRVE
ncbi:MAG: DegT/DnrJ/EryC1/StrS family aminotransferase [Armatimonadota bacterium]